MEHENRMRFTFLSAGAPRHGKNLRSEVQAINDREKWGWETQFWEWQKDGYESYDFLWPDWIWNMGNFETVFNWMAEKKRDYPKLKFIAQWIGTDILQHESFVNQGFPDPFLAADIHIADATNLQDEARQLTQMDVGLVRSIPPKVYAPTPITQWDNVLAYVPNGRDDFFRWAWILEVAKEYPDITFNIIARDTTDGLPANVICHKEIGGAEKEALFRKCFAYLRPIQHDGIGLTLIEMAQMGRWTLHTDTRIAYTLPARSPGEIMFQLDEIIRTEKQPPQIASDYYRSEFNDQMLMNDLLGLKAQMEK